MSDKSAPEKRPDQNGLSKQIGNDLRSQIAEKRNQIAEQDEKIRQLRAERAGWAKSLRELADSLMEDPSPDQSP